MATNSLSTSQSAPARLGNLLVERGYLTAETLQRALEGQQADRSNRLLGEILVEQGYCTEDQVVECLAAEYGVPYAKLEARLHDPKVVDIAAPRVHRREPGAAAVSASAAC